MPRWKALPESTDPRVRRLVVELRRLKDHSGLSMAALASRTGLSKSSWERYLNGRVTPPRQAVEAMADVCGGDRIGLAALWEVATSGTAQSPTTPTPTPTAAPRPTAAPAPAPALGSAPAQGSAPEPAAASVSGPVSESAPESLSAPAPAPAPELEPASAARELEQPEASEAGSGEYREREAAAPDGRVDTGREEARRGPRGRRPVATVAGVAVVAAALAVAVAVAVAITWPGSPSAEPESRAVTATTKVPTSTYSAETFPCYFTLRHGLLYAGHSTTVSDEYHVGITVEAVAEVQCLVRRHGFDPKGIDGSFGPHTRAAVQGFQRSRGLTADGIVGPMTWRELRKPGD
ncbi:helix-turn-helix domain-containing protein [Streptomyces sp. NPDC048278]|uniref:helix-turn-helix domain-containing protein n=1 Tax=Streptomyces sp. NPDC048278 TaxID=3155809 RepID=UPI0034241730